MIEHAKMTTLDEIAKAFDILLISESKITLFLLIMSSVQEIKSF